MNTEEYVPAHYFHIAIFEVERFMWSYGRGVGVKLIVSGIWDRGVDLGLVIRNIRNREVGESGDACGRRMSGGRCRNRICLWDGERSEWGRLSDLRFEWRGSRDMGFGISAGESNGCNNRSCSRVSLPRAGRVWPPGGEYRWGREALPPTLS